MSVRSFWISPPFPIVISRISFLIVITVIPLVNGSMGGLQKYANWVELWLFIVTRIYIANLYTISLSYRISFLLIPATHTLVRCARLISTSSRGGLVTIIVRYWWIISVVVVMLWVIVRISIFKSPLCCMMILIFIRGVILIFSLSVRFSRVMFTTCVLPLPIDVMVWPMGMRFYLQATKIVQKLLIILDLIYVKIWVKLFMHIAKTYVISFY